MIHTRFKFKKDDKWVVQYCPTVVVEYVILTDMLNFNSMINNCMRKTIFTG